MKFKSDIEVQAGLKDSSGAAGTSGQVLSSNGTTVSWINSGIGVASYVQNQVKAGVAINKGQAVYVTGADGTNIIVGLASNATEATSSKTLGLLNATVAINGFAGVIQIGKLAGLDTSTAVVGDPVWLGSNGNLIYGLANKPYAPLHLVYIGVVTRVNANNGEIFVSVQNGFELKEIHDVDIITTTPTNGDILGYNGSLWVNKTIPGWLGYTPVTNARTISTTAPLTGGGDLTANRTISMPAATTTVDGYLSAASFTIFNNKQQALNGTGFVKASGTTISYDNSTYLTSAVTTLSGGTTGLTPNTATSGAITLAGTLVLANGGTGSTTAAGARTNLGATTIGSNIFTSTNPSAINFLRANADNTVSWLDATTFRTAIGAGTGSGSVTSVGGTGTVSGLTLTGTVTSTGNLTLGGTLAVLPSNFASQTANTALAAPDGANGVPTFRALTLSDLPDAWVKRTVGCATTAALTINTAQTTIDGVTLAATTRVLVKDQTNAAENGIYTGLTTTTWVRAADANASSELAAAMVAVDAGAINGGLTFDTDFKSTDTLGTTPMNWSRVLDLAFLTTVGTSFATLPNPSAVTFPRINANNTVSALDAATFRTAIGAGSGSGTVTSVSGAGGYGGLTLTGTVTTTGSLTLGGTPTGTWPISVSGNAATSTAAMATITSAASAFKIPFLNTAGNTTGNFDLLHNSTATFTYNPSTSTLTVGTVSGALSGNATTATTLQTARTIGGVSFNGSANIDLPGVNTAGNQNTSGTAAISTAATATASATASAFKIPFLNTTGVATGNFGLLHDSEATFTYNPSTNAMVVGTVTASGGFFNSDIRLKNLTNYDYNISGIKPITYSWKDGRDDKKHIGYSAQEVQKVMPDAVNEGEDGMLSVNYVEVLVAKIAELENRIKQLEK